MEIEETRKMYQLADNDLQKLTKVRDQLYGHLTFASPSITPIPAEAQAVEELPPMPAANDITENDL